MRCLLYLLLFSVLSGAFGQGIVSTKPNLMDEQRRRPDGSIEPLTPSQILFLNTVTNVQQPGIHFPRNQYGLPGSQTPRITAQNLHQIDWTQIDRRIEDGWWHLYPFGERYFDRSLSNRPWMEKQVNIVFTLRFLVFRSTWTSSCPIMASASTTRL